MAQPMKVSILIGADASGAKAGAGEAEVALDDVADAGQRAANALNGFSDAARKGGAGLAGLGADAAAQAKLLDDLRAKYNPLYAAINRYKTEVAGIRQAHAVGALSINEMTTAITRERQATLASIDAIKGRSAALKAMPAANQNNSFNTANIAAQFQDIGVTAAMGMSPLQIALQQGTQLSMVFEQLRASGQGVGTSLVAAFSGLISPVSLVTLGVVALGAAAIQYFTSAATEAKSVDDVLAQHRENIKALGEAYGIAEQKAKSYSNADRAVAAAEASKSAADVKQKLAQEVKDLQDQFGTMVNPGRGAGNYFVGFKAAEASIQPFAELFAQLRKDSDIEKFAEGVKRIGDSSAANKEAADTILTAAKNSVDLNNALTKTDQLVSEISGARQRGFLVNDQQAQQDYAEALTEEYKRQKDAIDKIYKSGVTTRGFLVTSAQQLLNYENGLTDTYKRQNEEIAKAVRQRGFLVSDTKALADYENGKTETYLRQQKILDTLKQTQASFLAQQQQAAARTPAEKASAARSAAEATVIEGEDDAVRAQRIDLAEKTALLNANRDLQRAQEDRVRSANASLAAAQNELLISGQSLAVQAQLRAEFQAEAAYREQIARSGGTFNQAELDYLKQKAVLVAQINQQLAAEKALQQQRDDMSRLQLEISLVGASADVRAKSIAAYEVEKQIRDQGIASISREADALRAGAQARAEMQLQLERQQGAYQSLQQAEGSAIDALVTGTGSLKDRLKSALDSTMQWIEQIGIANPLKNMLTGTNLPTLGDLFTGKTASPLTTTTTAAMTVNAATVMINGTPIGGANPIAGLLSGANNNQPAAANSNIAGVIANSGTTKTGIPLSSISGPNGLTADVNSQYAGNFQGFINELQASGYQINSIGGYNYRNIAGTSTLSNHAYGNAIDINPMTNPDTGRGGALVTNMPPNVSEMAAKYGLSWGGDWQSKKDAMHFEVAKGAQPMQMQAANENIAKLGQTASKSASSIDGLSTGAVDATKALSSGSNSITGSVGTLASETAQVPAQTQGMFSSLFSSIGQGLSGLTSGIGSIFSSLLGGLFADGAAFSGGSVIAFADGGIVTRPTLFGMSGGRTGVMGEAGPEAIMPLKRGSDGKLGVGMVMPRQASRGAGGSTQVSLTSSHTMYIYGNGDKELHAQWREGTSQMLDERDRMWRDSFPDMAEAWRRDPHKRTSSL